MMRIIGVLILAVMLSACAVAESSFKKVDELVPATAAPQAKETSFQQPLLMLGKMAKTYGTKKLYVQCERVGDDTGAGQASGAEIPIDITEMIKTALNGIGGNVFYVPYNPNYIIGQERTGYKAPKGRITPNLVVSGAITEFDRALASTDRSLDLSIPGNTVSGGVGGGKGDTLSQITLDINLIDYDTMTMIPRMQAVNTVTVRRGKADSMIGFELFGAALGYKSGVKTVQGRHAAVRALVEMSVLEVVGRYLNLPYWRFLPNSKPDAVIMDNLKSMYKATDAKGRTMTVQKLLTMYGYSVQPSGNTDAPTTDALRQFKTKYMQRQDANVDEETFISLYVNVPLT
jgi:hypothetical protein